MAERKLLFLWLIMMPMLAQQAGATDAGLATLEGHVTNAMTGEAVRKALVHLTPNTSENRVEFVATTDSTGDFRFAGVGAGSYKLTCEKTGYLEGGYGRDKPDSPLTILKVGAGEKMKGLMLRMSPAGSISGNVVDADGDPEAGQRVTLWEDQSPLDSTDANQAGEYRFDGLSPGTYFVSADPSNYAGRIARLVRVDSEGRPTKVHDIRTFYPSALSMAEAQRIRLEAGQQQDGLAIQVRRGQLLFVHGRVAAQAGLPAGDTVHAEWTNQMGGPIQPGKLLANGEFIFEDMLPGRYRLTLSANRAGKSVEVGRAEITLADEDLNGIVITPFLPARVRVRVVMEGEEDKPLTAGSVFLLPMGDHANSQTQWQVDGDTSSYLLTNVSPGKYEVRFSNPGKAYRKAVRSGNQVIDPESVEVPEGGNLNLTLLYSKNGASLSGDVKLPHDAAKSPVCVFVTRNGEVYSADLDQYLHFSREDLAPGKYVVFAAQEDDFELWRNPQFVKLMEAEGDTVELEEKQHGSVQLNLVTKDTTDRIRRHLGL